MFRTTLLRSAWRTNHLIIKFLSHPDALQLTKRFLVLNTGTVPSTKEFFLFSRMTICVKGSAIVYTHQFTNKRFHVLTTGRMYLQLQRNNPETWAVSSYRRPKKSACMAGPILLFTQVSSAKRRIFMCKHHLKSVFSIAVQQSGDMGGVIMPET